MKINKIFLFYPPGPQYQRGEDRSQGNIDQSTATTMRAPNDMAYVSSQLDKIKLENIFTDYASEKKTIANLKKDFIAFSPDVLITSTTTSTINYDLDIIDQLKELKPNCISIIKSSLFFKAPSYLLDTLKLDNVEYLIGGEIEFAATNIIEKINSGKKDFYKIPGLFLKENNKWKETEFDNWNKEIDILPFPNRSKINNKLYTRPDTGEPQATIATSRGCPSSCVYCLTPTISGKKVRFRSPDSIIDEMKNCYYNHNIKNYFFKSDTFTIDHKWVVEVCKKINTSNLRNKIAWVANSRVKPIKEDTLKIMKDAGCWLIAFGFESGSPESMKKIKKGATIEDNLRAADLAKKAGLKLYGFFLIGLPWERESHLQETEKHIFDINSDFIELHIAVPYYGTELFSIAKKEGLLTVPIIGQNYFEESTVGTKYLNAKQLISFRRKVLFRYHTRINYIYSRLVEGFYDYRKMINYSKHGFKLIKNVIY